MSAVIRFYRYGDPSVLTVEDEQIGDPGRGQVTLWHEAIGVNFVDTAFRDGTFKIPLPAVPGIEGAGIVKAVGSGVSGFTVGDRVAYFYAPGSYAAVRLVEAAALVNLPEDISSELSAAVLAKGLTAWMAVHALHKLRAGETVLVQTASGGVGRLVAHWAKALGATVIGTAASPSRLAQVAQNVEHAFQFDDPDFLAKLKAIAPHGVDVVYEFVGQATFTGSVAAVRDGGSILTIGAASGQPRINQDEMTRRGIRVAGGGTPQYVKGATLGIAAAELFDLVRNGILGEVEINRYPLTEAARAHADVAARRRAGSPVLIPQ
jgi:NADPH2:quinone reductase